MIRIQVLLLLFLGSCAYTFAQDDFTYISDRKFFNPTDLIGYDFRPSYMEIPNETEEELSPGEYSFGITRSNLYVDGGDLKGVYSVNNINPTEYGYKLVLMNARDPRIQGHLKVILNKRAQVEALVFKRSNNEPEIIFFQTQIEDDLANEEADYFTDRYDLALQEQDSIWGTKIFPFMRIHADEGGVQERLHMSDSTSIEFVEKITIIEKKKKKKRKKKSKTEVDTEETIEPEEEEVREEVEIKELEVNNELEADPGAYPPVEEAENMEEVMDEEQEETVKVKIVKEYFLKIRTIQSYEDGNVKDEIKEIPIKKNFKLYETETNASDPTVTPFEMEISPLKGKPITMYLTKKQTVTAIQIEGKKYLMRGH